MKNKIYLIMLMLWYWHSSAYAAAIPIGDAQQTADLDGISLEIYTYRPNQCHPTSFLLVLHGMNRNADRYRDHAKPLGDELCSIIVAPYFDKERFPNDKYQRGGLTANDSNQWTGVLIERLVSWLRVQEQQPDWSYSLIGHSAGAQFLGRYAASIPNSAKRIVLANPGSYMFPSLDIPLPDGFAGMADAETALKRYLAEPLVILLGDEDTKQDRMLPEGYMDQGSNRHERGVNFFNAGKTIAAQHQWVFNWRLFEVPNIGHNSSGIFASPQALQALQP